MAYLKVAKAFLDKIFDKKVIFFFVQIVVFLFVFFYLTKQAQEYDFTLANLQDENSYYLDRTKRLKPNSVDLDYLDEKARKKLGLIDKNEIVIILDK